ncbi:MAG TPA: hypothetical protein ENI82_03640 [Bacteroidetes bacterium]|nr:hypothetical protein [Bacteroidota bacterium]
MPKLYFILFLFFTITSFHHYNHNPNDEWELVKSDEQMKVFTRISPDCAIKEVKVIGILNCSLNSVVQSLIKVEDYPKWIYKCKKAFQFYTINKDEFHYYVYTDMPFPFHDRDMVIHTRQWYDSKGVWYSSSIAKPDLLLTKKGVIRIKKSHIKWEIKKLTDQSVEYYYYISMDPGGALPAWLINLGIEKGPIGTLNALEKYSIEQMRKGQI